MSFICAAKSSSTGYSRTRRMRPVTRKSLQSTRLRMWARSSSNRSRSTARRCPTYSRASTKNTAKWMAPLRSCVCLPASICMYAMTWSPSAGSGFVRGRIFSWMSMVRVSVCPGRSTCTWMLSASCRACEPAPSGVSCPATVRRAGAGGASGTCKCPCATVRLCSHWSAAT